MKEKLISLRFWLGIVIAHFTAVTGYVITQFDKISKMLMLSCVIFLCVLFMIFVLLNGKIQIKIKEIGGL